EEQFMSQLAPYWIGRSRETLGDRVAAIAAYQRFVAAFAASVPAHEVAGRRR
ncbi:MAG: hypothetical protein JWM95_236, partial [Gemmatimonadetes bacterium]|nr:hypothetical protein [Gemmatimonadota bacterium]